MNRVRQMRSEVERCPQTRVNDVSRHHKSALGRNRTCDTRFRKPVLYPLSYEGEGCRRGGREHLEQGIDLMLILSGPKGGSLDEELVACGLLRHGRDTPCRRTPQDPLWATRRLPTVEW